VFGYARAAHRALNENSYSPFMEGNMQPYTDWIALWKELVENMPWHSHPATTTGEAEDPWIEKARAFDNHVKQRWSQGSDSSRDFVSAQVDGAESVLDIGAGTGAWACLLARHARRVTAVEPSPAMTDIMRETMLDAGLSNVQVIQQPWPEASVELHDFSLCSHAMYGQADLPAFVHSMMAVTRRTCFLVMRMPTVDAVMARATRHILGHPHDSPNGIVAYNAMLQMGLFPSILMENTPLWDPWTSASPEEAVAEIKTKLGLGEGPSAHDAFLSDLVHRSLTLQGDRYAWPRGIRSALVFWSVQA
jgi:SAM-dependent methyltransferase